MSRRSDRAAHGTQTGGFDHPRGAPVRKHAGLWQGRRTGPTLDHGALAEIVEDVIEGERLAIGDHDLVFAEISRRHDGARRSRAAVPRAVQPCAQRPPGD